MWQLAHNGHRLGILDGTLVAIDRLGGDNNRLYYSGKHHRHGVNLQALVDPRRGDLVWISDRLPGSTHDLTAARVHDIITMTARAIVEVLADKGCQGAGGTVITPHKGSQGHQNPQGSQPDGQQHPRPGRAGQIGTTDDRPPPRLRR